MSRHAEEWRPIDLARLAGVSTQQIRNYVDAEILPPVARTANGYRRFGPPHAAALRTYRALAAGFGPVIARRIMQEVHRDDVAAALDLIDAAHAALHEQRRALTATAEALEEVAAQGPHHSEAHTAPPRSGLRIGEVAARVGVRTSALRVWEAEGLLTPARESGTGYRTFDAADIRDAHVVAVLRRGAHPFDRIRAVLDGLRRTGSSAALHTALTRRRTELTARSLAMLDGSAQLRQYLSQRTER
ncbi:MerR family transcriptional regulator [Nocardia sp. NPDC004068]|uniref:MerR family transcriptional regulator n=1 Tax=Nocardia sp. NPDC004068 TaxID=3364303 RepID=UPI0036A882F2